MRRVWFLLALLAASLAFLPACTTGGGDDDDDSTGDDSSDDDDNDDSGDDSGDDDGQNDPPVIEHSELPDQGAGYGDYPVVATITDDGTVASATCFYRVNGLGDYLPLTMTAEGDVYTATIPEQEPGLVEYYLSATDDGDLTALAPADAPATVYSFIVLSAMEVSMDDGSAEDATRRISAGSQLLIDLTPIVYPVRMAKVRFYVHPDPGSLGKTYRAVVYEDPTGAGPSAANLLWTSDEFAVDDVGGFIDVDALPAGMDFASGSFVVGIENVDAKGPWVGLDESSAYLGRSWYYDAAADEYVNLSETPYAFNLMIRAIVLLLPQ